MQKSTNVAPYGCRYNTIQRQIPQEKFPGTEKRFDARVYQIGERLGVDGADDGVEAETGEPSEDPHADEMSPHNGTGQGVFGVYHRVAEREGFEPSVEILSLRRFSKPLPSATRPPLHVTSLDWMMSAVTADTVVRWDHRRRAVILPQPLGKAQGIGTSM